MAQRSERRGCIVSRLAKRFARQNDQAKCSRPVLSVGDSRAIRAFSNALHAISFSRNATVI
jgi:hypothetical protein